MPTSRKPLRRRSRKVPQPVKKYVKSQITKSEPKRSFTFEPYTGGEVTTTANLADLTAISQSGGDDPELYRDNQQIKPHAMQISGVWASKDTSTVDNYLRLIFFTWKEERGANPPSATEVFGDALTYPYLTKPFFDIDTTKGTVLWDKLYRLAPHFDGASQISGAKTIPIRKIINLSKHPKITYHSGAGTAGKNHIYVLVVGNLATGTQSSTLQLDTQLIYT